MWSPYTQANINKVEKVQRRAATWVSNDYASYSSVTQMLNTLGWRSLDKGVQTHASCCSTRLFMAWSKYQFQHTSAIRSKRPELFTPCITYKYPLHNIVIINTLSFLNCTVEKTPCPGCHIPRPEFFRSTV